MIYSKCPDIYQFVILCTLQKACSLRYKKLLKTLQSLLFFKEIYIFFKWWSFLPMKTGLNFIMKFDSFLNKIIKLLDFNQWYGQGYQCQPYVQSMYYISKTYNRLGVRIAIEKFS